MRSRKRRFSYWHEAARLVGNQSAPRSCHTFSHSPILWQTSSFEQLLSTRPILDILYYQQPPGPFLRRLSPISQVLRPRLTSVSSAMLYSIGYSLRCVSHRPPRIRCNSLHSMQPPHLRDRVRVVWDFGTFTTKLLPMAGVQRNPRKLFSLRGWVVEHSGFEPLTSTMRM